MLTDFCLDSVTVCGSSSVCQVCVIVSSTLLFLRYDFIFIGENNLQA